jgi:hypothetical protein
MHRAVIRIAAGLLRAASRSWRLHPFHRNVLRHFAAKSEHIAKWPDTIVRKRKC